MGKAITAIALLALVAGAAPAAAIQHCAYLEAPRAGEFIGPLWEARWSSRVQSLSCSVASTAIVEAEVLNQGASVTGLAPLRCSPQGTLVIAPSGRTKMPARAQLAVRIGTVEATCLAGANVGVACSVPAQCPGSECAVASLLLCFGTDR